MADARIKLPLNKPKPDIRLFCDVIKGKKIPEKPPFVELIVNNEIIQNISENILGKKWVFPNDRKNFELFWKNTIDFFYRFGYDSVRVSGGFDYKSHSRVTDDTAEITYGKRHWTDEDAGAISSWEDFEKYDWPSLDKFDFSNYEFVSANLPEGMGMFACPSSGVLENALGTLFGYTQFSYAVFDQPELVEAVFNRVGQILYGFYKQIIGMKNLYGFFQGDDLGFRSSTLVSPEILRKYVLPWHKKIAELAHKNGLIYIFHCCGNIENIMEDLIEDVKIDAKHSFEDVIMPVADFKAKYGKRIATLGGVDVDVLTRYDEKDLRKYVRDVLEKCMPGGRYMLGSGNSVANYIPVKNYLIMLDEGINFSNR